MLVYFDKNTVAIMLKYNTIYTLSIEIIIEEQTRSSFFLLGWHSFHREICQLIDLQLIQIIRGKGQVCSFILCDLFPREGGIKFLFVNCAFRVKGKVIVTREHACRLKTMCWLLGKITVLFSYYVKTVEENYPN